MTKARAFAVKYAPRKAAGSTTENLTGKNLNNSTGIVLKVRLEQDRKRRDENSRSRDFDDETRIMRCGSVVGAGGATKSAVKLAAWPMLVATMATSARALRHHHHHHRSPVVVATAAVEPQPPSRPAFHHHRHDDGRPLFGKRLRFVSVSSSMSISSVGDDDREENDDDDDDDDDDWGSDTTPTTPSFDGRKEEANDDGDDESLGSDFTYSPDPDAPVRLPLDQAANAEYPPGTSAAVRHPTRGEVLVEVTDVLLCGATFEALYTVTETLRDGTVVVHRRIPESLMSKVPEHGLGVGSADVDVFDYEADDDASDSCAQGSSVEEIVSETKHDVAAVSGVRSTPRRNVSSSSSSSDGATSSSDRNTKSVLVTPDDGASKRGDHDAESTESEDLVSAAGAANTASLDDDDDDHQRTRSFDAVWAGNLAKFYGTQQPSSVDDDDDNEPIPFDVDELSRIKIHTLVLGTHPSKKSLSKTQYYGHPLNAFWWIAGDCLGFRRDTGRSANDGKPYHFCEHLRFRKESDVIPYTEQVTRFCRHGFALWDLVRSCEREGSLDQDIRNEETNDVRAFCEQHPTIQRLVFSNGQTQCKLFLKHFKSWWDAVEEQGEGGSGSTTTILVPENNEPSRKVFGKRYSQRADDIAAGKMSTEGRRVLSCVCMKGVSPANARVTYEEKRDYWETYCYEPGLKDNKKLNGELGLER